MTWTGSRQQFLEIKDEVMEYAKMGGCDVTSPYRMLAQSTTSTRYAKGRIRTILRKASQEVEGNDRPRHSNLILKDIYEYKQYKERNENEGKNKNKTTGNR